MRSLSGAHPIDPLERFSESLSWKASVEARSVVHLECEDHVMSAPLPKEVRSRFARPIVEGLPGETPPGACRYPPRRAVDGGGKFGATVQPRSRRWVGLRGPANGPRMVASSAHRRCRTRTLRSSISAMRLMLPRASPSAIRRLPGFSSVWASVPRQK